MVVGAVGITWCGNGGMLVESCWVAATKTELAALYSLKEQSGPRRGHCDTHSDWSAKFLSQRNWQSLPPTMGR